MLIQPADQDQGDYFRSSFHATPGDVSKPALAIARQTSIAHARLRAIT